MSQLLFIEGIPGSGKSTLLNHLSQRLPQYHAYREGDLSPIELAWCAELSLAEYEELLSRYPDLDAEVRAHSLREGERMHVAYTQIHTDNSAFYADWEQHEIYSGRRNPSEFREIVFRRFAAYAAQENQTPSGAIFECSLFQNVLEELMLFACYSNDEILAFYRELFTIIRELPITLIRLIPQDIAAGIELIRKERVNEQGEEVWYQMMLAYLTASPYGRQHAFTTFDDLLAHFRRRIALEQRIIADCFPGRYLELPSKAYDLDEVLSALK